MSLKYLNTLGGRGSGPDKWQMRLVGLACCAEGRLCVLGDSTVREFDADGHPVSDFELDRLPWSLGLDDANESLLVGFDGEVACYNRGGDRVGGFVDKPRLGRVTAIERVGDCLVAGDATGRCLRVYDLDGRWIRDVGNDNRTQGLLIPNGVVDFDVDRVAGALVVANPAKHRLERYALDGTLLGFWGRFGMHDAAGFSGCCNPTNVAMAADGRVVVTEKAPPRLKAYSSDGELLAATATSPFDPQAKNMCVAADGPRVYVADTARLTVLTFEWVEDGAETDGADVAPGSAAPLAGALP